MLNYSAAAGSPQSSSGCLPGLLEQSSGASTSSNASYVTAVNQSLFHGSGNGYGLSAEFSGSSIADIAAQYSAVNASLWQLQAQVEASLELTSLMWKVAAAFLVFLMQLGFSLLEAGTVRFKNTRNIMIKNVLDTCVCAIAFWLLGYGIAFGSGSKFFGWEDSEGQVAYANTGDQVDCTFAAISATIVAGAIAERTHLWAYLTFNFFLSAFIYPVVAHIVWSDQGLLSASADVSILNCIGVLDKAGSMVVHVTGGVTSLVGALMVGPRIGRFDIEGKVVHFKGYSMVFIAAGTIILWVGFYGFNGGSVGYEGQQPLIWAQEVAWVCVNTTISASTAGVTVWLLTFRQKKPQPEDTFNGVIGGLVAACATSSIVLPYAAAIVGIGAGLAYLLGCFVMHRHQIDDPVQAAAVHLFCGTWGALAAGLFATKDRIIQTYNEVPDSWGLFYGGGIQQLFVQIIGLLVVYVWVGLTTSFVFFSLRLLGVLRVTRREEEVGLDVAFHGGEDKQEDMDVLDSQHGGRRVILENYKERMPGVLDNILRLIYPKRCAPNDELWVGGGEGRRNRGKLEEATANVPLGPTPFGQYSLAMYEANYVMEDTADVKASTSGVYLAVHDGHGGTTVSNFLKSNLYPNLKQELVRRGGHVAAEAIKAAFKETDDEFAHVVRESFEQSPHFATVGSCSVVAIVTSSTIWVANVGDCRAVLGQVLKSAAGQEQRAVQLSVDHNVNYRPVRERFIREHPHDPDAITEKKGVYPVKGKVLISRAFGDMYLKTKEFNREPLVARYRVPEPYFPPLLTAEPNIAVRILSPHDAFVILASDGLFEYVSNQEAVDIVVSSPRKDVAKELIRVTLRRAAEKKEIRYSDLLRMPSGQRREFHDDISVVVFFFNHQASEKKAANASGWKNKIEAEQPSSVSATATDLDFQFIHTMHGANDARNAISLLNTVVHEGDESEIVKESP